MNSNSPKLIENYNRDVAYFRGSMDFIVIQMSKLPLHTQLIEFPSNPIRAMNALITRNIRPQFDKTVTKSGGIPFQLWQHVTCHRDRNTFALNEYRLYTERVFHQCPDFIVNALCDNNTNHLSYGDL